MNINEHIEPYDEQTQDELFKKLKAGDPSVREGLIIHNIPLIYLCLNKYSYFKYNEDLISVLKLTLIKAVDNFDPDKNVKFSTFALKCLKNDMIKFLKKDCKIARHETRSTIITNEDHPETTTKFEFVEDTSCIQDFENVEYICSIDKFKNYLKKKLYPRDYKIFEYRFLHYPKHLTCKQIADEYGLTRQEINHIEHKVLRLLKSYSERQNLTGMDFEL